MLTQMYTVSIKIYFFQGITKCFQLNIYKLNATSFIAVMSVTLKFMINKMNKAGTSSKTITQVIYSVSQMRLIKNLHTVFIINSKKVTLRNNTKLLLGMFYS